MGGGEGRQMPPQAQGSTMSATVGSSLGCGGSRQKETSKPCSEQPRERLLDEATPRPNLESTEEVS